MSERNDDVVEALLVPSRDCTICRTVLSAIRGGAPVDRALVSGLLAAYSVIREQHRMLLDGAMKGPSVSIFAGRKGDPQ